jgi:drug/metabolite transporter (DMT)-like permease
MFFLVASSSAKAGISITTTAGKMSVIFPIVFSMIIDPSDQLSILKSAAIGAALIGVALTVYKPGKGGFDRTVILIPLLLFVGMGIVDSLVKFAQHRSVDDSETALFSAVLFFNAFLSGLIILLFRPRFYRSFTRLTNWGWGVLLGAVNFGSIYFLVRALNYISPAGNTIDSSVIFGINNIGVVALSVMTGLLVFRERLASINWVGISISALALLLFTLVT